MEHLRERFAGRPEPTVAGPEMTIDFASSTLRMEGEAFPFPALSPVAQSLIVADGAENQVRRQLSEVVES